MPYLERLKDRSAEIKPIEPAAFQMRMDKAVALMKKLDLAALFLNAGTNLYYFTGLKWHPSERLVGALLTNDGQLIYLCPQFEKGTVQDFMLIDAEIRCWEEHDDPYYLLGDVFREFNISPGTIAVDETAPIFVYEGIKKSNWRFNFVAGDQITTPLRMHKSKEELAIMKTVKSMTLDVQALVPQILKPGISTAEVTSFINAAHLRIGAPAGSYFCIVLFGPDTAFPHGVKHSKLLEKGDMVLIDTGCQIEGYISDITRSYVFGKPSDLQRKIWDIELEAQYAAFDAAKIDAPCHAVDDAARKVLENHGLGPLYKLPGLPHRTGHGIGLNIHEAPYMVKGNELSLSAGMCASIEPMICVPDKFGVRLEDHFYMTAQGAKWFTSPSKSIDQPFGVDLDFS